MCGIEGCSLSIVLEVYRPLSMQVYCNALSHSVCPQPSNKFFSQSQTIAHEPIISISLPHAQTPVGTRCRSRGLSIALALQPLPLQARSLPGPLTLRIIDRV